MTLGIYHGVIKFLSKHPGVGHLLRHMQKLLHLSTQVDVYSWRLRTD